MADVRDVIVDWVEQGHIRPDDVPRVFAATGITPDAEAWRHFLSRLLLWLGALLVGAGVIFFFAYNWQDLGRMQKFALLEGTFAIAAFMAWFRGPDHVAGQAALLLTTLLTGALLALVGQTYQTGADTYELFAMWAVLILPFVAVARMQALWLLLLTLINLALDMYFLTFRGLFGMVFTGHGLAWLLFALNVTAQLMWEYAARSRPWMQSRWAVRLIGVASGALATMLAVTAVLDLGGWWIANLAGYAAWVALVFYVYRWKLLDLFMLAGWVLSLIVFITAALGRLLLESGQADGFLLLGMMVIAMSAAGAWWLREIAAREDK